MSGFTNILLDNESSLATTFHTPFGRCGWLRLPYCVSSGPEVYHARQQEALAGLRTFLQDHQPLAFYSNTLTASEQRYAIIEKECLAICLANEKCDSLLYGESDITGWNRLSTPRKKIKETPLQSTKEAASHAHEAPTLIIRCELQERSTTSHSRHSFKGSSSSALCS